MGKLKAVVERRWLILVTTFVIGVVAGFLSTSTMGAQRGITTYVAEQVILANRLSGNPANVTQDALKVNRGAVPARAAELLGGTNKDNLDGLAGRVRATAQAESNSIVLSVNDTEPKRASAIVQAFTAAFLEVVNAELKGDDQRQLEELTSRVTDAQKALQAFDQENGFVARGDVPLPNTQSIDALVAERRRLDDAVQTTQNQLDQFKLQIAKSDPYSSLGPEKPSVAAEQLIEVPDSPIFRAGLLGVISLLLGVGLVFIIERVHQRIDTREELAALISVPIIAEIGKIPARRRPTDAQGRLNLNGVWSEHYRRVRSAIQFVQTEAELRGAASTGQNPGDSSTANAVIAGHRALSGDEPRIFLFASALPSEGKSTSVALTALALAEVGVETLVVNGDFRRPKVEQYLGTVHSPNLADRAELSVDRPSLDEIVQPTDVDHLWIAASGPATHEVSGRLAAAKEVAAEAASRGGTVLIDSSPLRVSNEPIDLLAAVDEVILIVRAGRTTVKSIEDTMDLLEMHHAPILGVILIGTLATREMYAYYDSYYRNVGVKPDGGGPVAPTDESEQVPAEADVEHGEPIHARGVRLPEAGELPTLPPAGEARQDPPSGLPPLSPPPYGQTWSGTT